MTASETIHEILPSPEQCHSPKLTAILVICGPFREGEKALRCLAAQTIAEDIEMILVTDHADIFKEAEPLLQGFGCVQRITGDVTRLPHLRAACTMLARAPFIGYCEDHSFLDANWAEELVSAFESDPDVVAVAPAFVNPNADHPLSRALFSCHFGRFSKARWKPGLHVCPGLPWHNTAYRLDILSNLGGDEVAKGLEVEGFLQEQIREKHPACVFILNTRTGTSHVNMSLLWPACRHGFTGGRFYALERSARRGWSPLRRLIQAFASPLVPAVRLFRDRHFINAHTRGPVDGMNVWLRAWVVALFHATGEAAGCILPRLDLVRVYSDFECRRIRFVSPADTAILLP